MYAYVNYSRTRLPTLPPHTPRMLRFGARFKNARLSAGHTQDSLADVLGVTKSAVSAWENDRGTPSFENLGPIRAALGVSLDELVVGTPPAAKGGEEVMVWPALPPREQARTPEERSMLRVFRAMSDHQRRGLIAAFTGAPPSAGVAGASQDLSPADLSMAIQLANEKIAAAGLAPSPAEYGELVVHLHDLLVGGLAHADLHDLRTGKLVDSITGGDSDVSTASETAGEGRRTAESAVQYGGKARRKP